MKNVIHIDHLGYLIGMPKIASCITKSRIFYIIDAKTESSVYTGKLSKALYDKDSNENVKTIDFSGCDIAGEYYIRIGRTNSDKFKIMHLPLASLRKTVLDSLFLNRCGYDYSKDSIHFIKGTHFMCHSNKIDEKDITGGWHNGGDYNRYTISSCITVAHMIYSLRLFSKSFSKNEKVCLYDECKWGIEWLLKMQDKDGEAYSGISCEKADELMEPSDDTREYTLLPKTLKSTLFFTAVMALASSFFEDESFNAKLKKAAEKSWICLSQADIDAVYKNEKITISEKTWLLCEMYSLTGDSYFSDLIKQLVEKCHFGGFIEENVGGFAALSYLLSKNEKDEDIEKAIRKRIIAHAELLKNAIETSGYRIAISVANRFSKGSNAVILSDGMSFALAFLVSKDKRYLNNVLEQVSYILGRNPNSISYVTCVGNRCCKKPFHHSFSTTDNSKTIPGMVVGGANKEYDDNFSKWSFSKNTPPMKCYIDDEHSVSTNEPYTHYSTPLIFLSAFLSNGGTI